MPNPAYLCGLRAGSAKGVNQNIYILPSLLPECTFPDGVLTVVTVAAQADSAPVVRLLPHASAGTEANMCRLNPCIAMTYRTAMAADEPKVSLGTPAGFCLGLFRFARREH